ncbi:RCC1 domain-containing protein [Microbacterium trichothecenolyticum]|nr:hypothetical protein [Microbacterium trichothecenolyticum]
MGDGGQAGGDSAGSGAVRSSAGQLTTVFPSPIKQLVSCGTATGQGSNQSTFALLLDGSVWSIGGNGFGQLGNGSYSPSTTWIQISGLSGVQQLSAGAESVYALLSDNTVAAWGDNWFGQLGTGGTQNSVTSPAVIPGLSNVTQIAAASQQVYFLLSDRTVRALGRNAWGPENAPDGRGALGNGNTTSDVSTVPVVVSNLANVTQIAGGSSFGLALMGDGSVRAWGNNSSGQLGNGTTTSSAVPVTVSGSLLDAAALAANLASAYALRASGAIAAWGKNTVGQLGDGTTVNRSVPVAVTGVTDATQVAASGSSAYAVVSDGSVKAWGQNTKGELGDTTTTNRSAPVLRQRLERTVGLGAHDTGAEFLAHVRRHGESADHSLVAESGARGRERLGRCASDHRIHGCLRRRGSAVGIRQCTTVDLVGNDELVGIRDSHREPEHLGHARFVTDGHRKLPIRYGDDVGPHPRCECSGFRSESVG